MLDLRRRFFRERSGQVGAADALLTRHRSDRAGDAAEQVGGLDRIEIPRGPQQSHGERADGFFPQWFGGVANPGLGAEQQAAHQR
jgi:hypothetical protein